MKTLIWDGVTERLFEPIVSEEKLKQMFLTIRNGILLQYDNSALRNYIITNFVKLYATDRAIPELLQLYSKLGILPDKYNSYLEHANIIERMYGLDMHILDVGAGYIPVLSEIIASRQINTKAGKITAIDLPLNY